MINKEKIFIDIDNALRRWVTNSIDGDDFLESIEDIGDSLVYDHGLSQASLDLKDPYYFSLFIVIELLTFHVNGLIPADGAYILSLLEDDSLPNCIKRDSWNEYKSRINVAERRVSLKGKSPYLL